MNVKTVRTVRGRAHWMAHILLHHMDVIKKNGTKKRANINNNNQYKYKFIV